MGDSHARLVFCTMYYENDINKIFSSTYYRHIFVDEAQDIAKNEYRLIKLVSGSTASFNLFGDVNQCMHPERGIKFWSGLYQMFPGAIPYTLNNNYGNRDEIIQYCNTIPLTGSHVGNMKGVGLSGGIVEEINIKELNRCIQFSPCPADKRHVIIIPKSIKKEIIYSKVNSPQVTCFEIASGKISIMYTEEVKGFEFEKAYVLVDHMSPNEQYTATTRALDKLTIVHIR